MVRELSVVIPVYNSLDTLKITLQSVVNNTKNLKELVLVDDYSAHPTQSFLDSLQLEPALNIRLTKTRNPRHLWTNASWRIGVALSTKPYIAVLNSDITVSPDWDDYLMDTLSAFSVACPYTQVSKARFQRLDPLIEKIDPEMIQGACFMFKDFNKEFFNLSPNIKHWYLDRYVAQKASRANGVGFNRKAIITHKVSSSSRDMDPQIYQDRIKEDTRAYEAFTGKKETLIRKEMGWD